MSTKKHLLTSAKAEAFDRLTRLYASFVDAGPGPGPAEEFMQGADRLYEELDILEHAIERLVPND